MDKTPSVFAVNEALQAKAELVGGKIPLELFPDTVVQLVRNGLSKGPTGDMGPMGPKGPTGDMGPMGPKGPDRPNPPSILILISNGAGTTPIESQNIPFATNHPYTLHAYYEWCSPSHRREPADDVVWWDFYKSCSLSSRTGSVIKCTFLQEGINHLQAVSTRYKVKVPGTGAHPYEGWPNDYIKGRSATFSSKNGATVWFG